MKNKGIVFFLILLAVIIVVMIVVDYRTERPGRSEANPFALNVDEYKSIDPSLIHYKEAKNFNPGFDAPAAIKVANDKLYVAGDNKLKIVAASGNLLSEFTFEFIPHALEVADDKIYLAGVNRVFVYNEAGTLLNEWPMRDDDSRITSIAVAGDNVFIADAGRRKIFRYSPRGELLDVIDGKAEEGALHGFIIPSPFFDIAINSDQELWVVNPGLHSLENYSFDGRLRGHWKQWGVHPEGFSGCCNPGHFTFLSDGRFVTSEKGLVRIKTYRPSGELDGVVAAPAKFADNGLAPDVAADSKNNIYALDFERKMIRVFSPVE